MFLGVLGLGRKKKPGFLRKSGEKGRLGAFRGGHSRLVVVYYICKRIELDTG